MLNKDILLNHIIKIFDQNNQEVLFNILDIKYEKRKHSQVYSNILYIDNIPCSGKQLRTYKVQYLCRCGRYITILLHKYLNKQNLNCMHCLQDRTYEDSVKTKPYELKKGIRNKEIIYKKEFEEYSEEFKHNYLNKHLTEKEFFNYLPIIYRLNNIILTDNIRKTIKYKYADFTNNQSKFCSKIYINNNWESIYDIALQCNICKKIFKIHLINLRKKDINNIRCRQCNFNTIPFTIKQYKNTTLTYQSQLEKTFLDYCFNYGIKVMNGFEIPYWHENKLKTYITDFYLPEHKIILELKGSNPYFIQDLKSGKIEAKNSYANQFAKNHGLKFKFIRDYNLEKFIYNLSQNLKKYIIKYYI